MIKRYRTPSAKEGELLVKYGKNRGELDIFYCWRGDFQMKRDSKLLSFAFEEVPLLSNQKSLRQELIDRGYDITTFKFSIQKLPAQDIK